MRPRAAICSAAVLACFLLLGASSAKAQSNLGAVAYRFATQAALSGFFPYDTCNSGICSEYGSGGGPAYTSDTYIAYHWTIFFAADGEVVSTLAIKPDGSVAPGPILTWHNYASVCGGNEGDWTDQYGGYYCDPTGYGEFIAGVSINCQPSGAWNLQLTDNGVVKFSTPITLGHSPSAPIGITSPTDNQLINLDQQNYSATNPIPLIAFTNGGGLINWNGLLSYNTSLGDGYFTQPVAPFSSNSGQQYQLTYQSEGGRVKLMAQTTLSDNSIVQDCVTFYVQGTQSFDPTSPLLSLYTNGATPRLMTGIAQHEGTYEQFFSQSLLDATAMWPHESYDGGSHIGLMMVPTNEAVAWDWLQNTSDGVNSTDHGFVGSDLPAAATMVNWIIAGAKPTKQNQLPSQISAHVGLQALQSPSPGLENMTLVDYGPSAHRIQWTLQYYIPVCVGTISKTSKGWTCSTKRYWAVNDPLVDTNVQANYIFPSGATGTFGNHTGVIYVSNPSDPKHPGVRDQMH